MSEAWAWQVETDVDRMTGEHRRYALSDLVKAEALLIWPYAGIRSWVQVDCDGKYEGASIGFLEPPNLVDEVRKIDGWDDYDILVQWDDDPKTTEAQRMRQRWGGHYLHVLKDDEFIKKLQARRSLRVALNWYGQGRVTFSYALTGSNAAISQAVASCREVKRRKAEEQCKAGEWCKSEKLKRKITSAGYPCKNVGLVSLRTSTSALVYCDVAKNAYLVEKHSTAIEVVRGGQKVPNSN